MIGTNLLALMVFSQLILGLLLFLNWLNHKEKHSRIEARLKHLESEVFKK